MSGSERDRRDKYRLLKGNQERGEIVMENCQYSFKRIGLNETEKIKELFRSVFTAEPWNDDWSDTEQLNDYLHDLTGQGNSLTYGLYDGGELIGVSMGHIRHWYSGTEYCIDEFCIKTDRQGTGAGTYFLKEIEKAMKEIGLVQIFLQTEKNVPAYRFYEKNGFWELKEHVSFAKDLRAFKVEREAKSE